MAGAASGLRFGTLSCDAERSAEAYAETLRRQAATQAQPGEGRVGASEPDAPTAEGAGEPPPGTPRRTDEQLAEAAGMGKDRLRGAIEVAEAASLAAALGPLVEPEAGPRQAAIQPQPGEGRVGASREWREDKARPPEGGTTNKCVTCW